MAGKRLAGDVRQMLERFLAAACRLAQPPAQLRQRIDDDRRAGDADQSKPRIVVEQQHPVADQCQRLLEQIADGLGDYMLHLPDVVGDPREQLSGRSAREEAGRLAQHVGVQSVAQVADHALPDICHQVVGEVPAQPLQQVCADNSDGHLPDALLARQHTVQDGLDLGGQKRRGDGIDKHRRNRPDEPQAIRGRVAEQAQKGVHSVKRYFSSTHSATTPSRHVIFLPSS